MGEDEGHMLGSDRKKINGGWKRPGIGNSQGPVDSRVGIMVGLHRNRGGTRVGVHVRLNGRRAVCRGDQKGLPWGGKHVGYRGSIRGGETEQFQKRNPIDIESTPRMGGG